ncbi:MAG: hypothetical protein PHP89_01985 [Candidatus Omnitrophica bacterium]|jgi:hypothetical protein|nr:hypothetical protein [Candidatus Omnitrophota bacterium]MDD4982170.1 hypothetical protein [Candidatus Omnitrophota bacterium]MDD5665498.1 hypothetical protein [Candidatus Omnitrophota bacterium]
MIKKALLLSQLKDLIENEKMLVPLLNRHISSALFFSGIDTKEQEKIKERFQAMVLTQTQHVEALLRIKEDVEGGSGDVY